MMDISHKEFMSVLHLLMDKYETFKGCKVWEDSGTNVLDDFYDFCEKKKWGVVPKQGEPK